MSQPLWRECVDWLDRCRVLRSSDFPPDSELILFGQFIRDGVVLCHLITKLDPTALDFREVCQRTQMSQVLYINIMFSVTRFKLLFLFSTWVWRTLGCFYEPAGSLIWETWIFLSLLCSLIILTLQRSYAVSPSCLNVPKLLDWELSMSVTSVLYLP